MLLYVKAAMKSSLLIGILCESMKYINIVLMVIYYVLLYVLFLFRTTLAVNDHYLKVVIKFVHLILGNVKLGTQEE